MTDLGKLLTGQGGEVLPKFKIKELDAITQGIGDVGATIGKLADVFKMLLIPQQETVFKNKEVVVMDPEQFHFEDDITQPIYNITEAGLLLGLGPRVVIGYQQKKIIDKPATPRITYQQVEDTGRSFVKSSWNAFSYWSSIPLLQAAALGVVGAPIALSIGQIAVKLVDKIPSPKQINKQVVELLESQRTERTNNEMA